ncbi:hypothetical protein BX661DRAFT_206312 [Kickxella alabastrina]|uniref:uncharacterized protein n=1 Tax=Kickxella alabastrina TaxID=61397 RepID=UPI00221E94FF|nr:uncharacterized protein BX661DRAFT_206312 [Kickxella alabastrina]KAI7825509.1 hypothetical protein BX661DRAFT_206312 [Kickxella alabastrina]
MSASSIFCMISCKIGPTLLFLGLRLYALKRQSILVVYKSILNSTDYLVVEWCLSPAASLGLRTIDHSLCVNTTDQSNPIEIILFGAFRRKVNARFKTEALPLFLNI